MDTSEISYRVADFLSKHPPFTAIGEADRLALAANGRVRFHEAYEYLLWQGEPHRHQIFVIQQGTVSLWDDSGGHADLRDVRGPGDMLGIERYHGARQCRYSARAETDVVLYAFPEEDFTALVLQLPYAADFVSAEGRLTQDYESPIERREPHRAFLHSLVGSTPPLTCRSSEHVSAVAARLLAARSEAAAVLGDNDRIRGVITPDTLLHWIARGGGNADQESIEAILDGPPVILRPDAMATDGVIAMGAADAAVAAMTTDGTSDGRLQALVGHADFLPLFGEQPGPLLRGIRRAATVNELKELNQRTRALTLDRLAGPAAIEWLTRFTHLANVAVLQRLLAIFGDRRPQDCWMFGGASGRGESLTLSAPRLALVVGDREGLGEARRQFDRVSAALLECGYLVNEPAFEPAFYVATIDEWDRRFRDWIGDPVLNEVYKAQSLFDLSPVAGSTRLWDVLVAAIAESVDANFLHVLANDCLASLPPLTFYEDAVVDRAGEHQSTFLLEQSALRPLVDVGRVFGLAAGAGLGRSTLERFETARTLLPAHEDIFREAGIAFRAVLWQQGRVGISQGTSGSDLPPALLSRHDRHVLKSGFRAILDLLKFTADADWIAAL